MGQKRRIAGVLLALVATLVACKSDESGTAPTIPAEPSTTAEAPSNPAATAPRETVAQGRRVTWMNVTFTIPNAWQDFQGGQTFAAGPRIYDWRGYAIGRINAVAGFDGSIDELNPRACLRQASGAAQERPSSYSLLESGFAPVGDRTAQFRRWSATCAAGVEEHRAWVLPVSRIAIYEVCHSPDTVAVARNTFVTDATTPAQAARPPWPNEIPGSCRDDLTDSATGT